MNTTFYFFFFLIIFLLTKSSSQEESCSNSFCSLTEPVIHFPFRLENDQRPKCGHPGFDLFCDAFNRTLVSLPNSGNFSVHAIDYATQYIRLNDPDNCLPKRLLNLNLTGSPFNGGFYQDFTFFNCSSSFEYYAKNYKFNPIGCLSGDNYTVFASSSERAVGILAERCSLIATVAVPVQWEFFEPVTTSDLGDDIRLSWGEPRCGGCETRGGRCGFGLNSVEIECRNVVRHGMTKSARYAIVIGLGLPALLILVGILLFLCNRVKNCNRRNLPIVEFSVVVVAPHRTTSISGLDGITIESYPKTILGESCRLPYKPEDNICSICLSEYIANDTLRSIPECRHCFHAECIDEWLRLNRSCPICRNSPKSKPLKLNP